MTNKEIQKKYPELYIEIKTLERELNRKGWFDSGAHCGELCKLLQQIIEKETCDYFKKVFHAHQVDNRKKIMRHKATQVFGEIKTEALLNEELSFNPINRKCEEQIFPELIAKYTRYFQQLEFQKVGEKRTKHSIIISIFTIIVSVLGLTIAFFTSWPVIKNYFHQNPALPTKAGKITS